MEYEIHSPDPVEHMPIGNTPEKDNGSSVFPQPQQRQAEIILRCQGSKVGRPRSRGDPNRRRFGLAISILSRPALERGCSNIVYGSVARSRKKALDYLFPASQVYATDFEIWVSNFSKLIPHRLEGDLQRVPRDTPADAGGIIPQS